MRRTFLLPVLLLGFACTQPEPKVPAPPGKTPVAWTVPDTSKVPDGPAKLGLELANNTYEKLPDYVGNKLHCTSCHLTGATTANASPWVGVTHDYPSFRKRVGGEVSLEQRINSCFERSMNGKALPADSDEMKALLAYMTWLSKDIPEDDSAIGRGIPHLDPPAEAPNSERGKGLFLQKCASCHGQEGQGTYLEDGTYQYPALWGDDSFNIAAGMGRRNTFAAFIKHKMPFGSDESLSVQEAYDIAAYVDSQERPDLPGKEKDWPDGGAPPDVPYKLDSAKD